MWRIVTFPMAGPFEKPHPDAWVRPRLYGASQLQGYGDTGFWPELVSRAALVVVQSVRRPRVQPLLPRHFPRDHAFGVHVRRHAFHDREPEVFGIAHPQQPVAAVTRGSVVQPPLEKVLRSVR